MHVLYRPYGHPKSTVLYKRNITTSRGKRNDCQASDCREKRKGNISDRISSVSPNFLNFSFRLVLMLLLLRRRERERSQVLVLVVE